MESKKLWQSKTFWFNIITGVTAFIGTNAELIPPKYSIPVLSASNIIMRLMSNTAITVTTSKDGPQT